MCRRAPKEPSREEVDEHNVTHTPYRSWCPHCVSGRAKDYPHKRLEDDEKGIAISKSTFATEPLYTIGAFAVLTILAFLYAFFWG